MDERQRDELREAAGVGLDPRESADVENPVRRGVDVAVHDRRGAPDPQPVRRPDDRFPRIGGQFSFGEEPADVVIEDLGGGSGHRVEPRVAEFVEERGVRDAAFGGAGHDLHRAERMDMHAGDARLHGADQVPIEGGGQVRMDPALHAHLGRAGEPRLLGAIGDLARA